MAKHIDDPHSKEDEEKGMITRIFERVTKIPNWGLVNDLYEAYGPGGDANPVVDVAEIASTVASTGLPGIKAAIDKSLDDIGEVVPKSPDELDRMAKDDSNSRNDPMMEELAQAQFKDQQALQDLKAQQENERLSLMNTQESQKQDMLDSLQNRGVDESKIHELLAQQQKVFEEQRMQQQKVFKEEQKQIQQQHEKLVFHPPPDRYNR